MSRKLFFSIVLIFLAGCHSNQSHIYNGYVEGRFTYVSSQTTETLQAIFVTKGDWVKQNTLLFQLNITPDQAGYEQAKSKLAQSKATLVNISKPKRPTEIAAIKAQIKQIEARLNFAVKTADRLTTLKTKGYANQEQLDRAVSDANDLRARLLELSKNLATSEESVGRQEEITAAEADVRAAQAALDKAEWMLSQTKIYAPIDGSVFDTFYRIGEVVPAQHPVLSLLSPKNIYVVFYVPEKQFSLIKMGQKLSVTCDNCQKTILATIYYISPTAEYTPQVFYTENSRSKFVFRVEASLSEQDAVLLHPGQPVDVKLETKN